MRSRDYILAAFVAVMFCFAASLSASEGGYVKKWYWTDKEKRELDELEKKVVKVPEGFSMDDGRGSKSGTGVPGYQLETENWIVFTEINPRFTAEMGKFLEIHHAIFSEIFNFKTGCEVKQKVTAVMFNGKAHYLQICGIAGSRGVFMHAYSFSSAAPSDPVTFSIWHLFTYMEAERTLSFGNCYHPVIQHEGTHAMLQRMLGTKRLPVWLNEGFATFYEYWDLRSDASPSGKGKKDKEARKNRLQTSPTKNYLRDNISKNRGYYPELSYLVGLKTQREWNVDGMGPQTFFHYSLAESFADFLISSKDGAKWVKTMIDRVVKDEEAKPAAKTKSKGKDKDKSKDDEDKGEDEDEFSGPNVPDVLTPEEIAILEPQWYAFLKNTWGINGLVPAGKGKKGK